MSHIIAAAKDAGVEVEHACDALSKGGSPPQVAKVLEALRGGKMCLTVPWPEDVGKSSVVEDVNTGAFRMLTDQKEFGGWLFNHWLKEALVTGTCVPSPEIGIVEGGIEGVRKALDLHKKGLEWEEMVVPLK